MAEREGSINLNGSSKRFLAKFDKMVDKVETLGKDVELIKNTATLSDSQLRADIAAVRTFLRMMFGGFVTIMVAVITVLGAFALK